MKKIPEIPKDIFKQVRTKEELNRFLQAVEDIKSNLYRAKTGDNFETWKKFLPERLALTLQETAAHYAREGKLSELAEVLDEFKSYAEKLPVLRLYVALEPSEKFLESIKDWVVNNLSEDVIVDISVDREILGGARLIFRGRFKEVTLSQLVDAYFKNEGSVILAELKP